MRRRGIPVLDLLCSSLFPLSTSRDLEMAGLRGEGMENLSSSRGSPSDESSDAISSL